MTVQRGLANTDGIGYLRNARRLEALRREKLKRRIENSLFSFLLLHVKPPYGRLYYSYLSFGSQEGT